MTELTGEHMVNDRVKLVWDDVEEAAKLAFKVWVDQPELRWAKEAWELLNKAGMTEFSSELQRCEVAIRFVALCDRYLDFCCVAWEENVGSDYSGWAQALGLESAFRVGQLVGPVEEFNDEVDDATLIDDAIGLLAGRARNEVLEGLEEGFGDRSMLFLSLWQSNIPTLEQFEDEGGDPEDYDRRYETNPSEVLNVVTPQKAEAFQWLDQGAYPYRH